MPFLVLGTILPMAGPIFSLAISATIIRVRTDFSKIAISVKNPNSCRKLEFLSKIKFIVKKTKLLSKIKIFLKKRNFCQKSNFSSKNKFFFTNVLCLFQRFWRQMFCKKRVRTLPISDWFTTRTHKNRFRIQLTFQAYHAEKLQK